MIKIVLLVVLLSGIASSVKFQDCGSTAGRVDDVIISNCDPAAPVCVLQKDTDVSLQLLFTPNKPVNSIVATLSGVMQDMEMPFPLSNAVVCIDEKSGVTCPLAADVQAIYQTTMAVLPIYPSISVIAKWELKDEYNANIVCVKIPVRIA